MIYATIDEVKQRLSTSQLSDDDDSHDVQILRYLYDVSRRVDDAFFYPYPAFTPTVATKRYIIRPDMVNSAANTFRFPDPLLSLTSVTVSGQALTLNTDVVAHPYSSLPPFHDLRLVTGGTLYNWYENNTNPVAPPYVDITGVWGIHRDYTNAWLSSDTLGANMTDSATSFTGTDTNGAGFLRLIPALSGGALVKIDSEYMVLKSANHLLNTCEIAQRGVNGTTAAAHSSGATIYVWQMDGALRDAVSRQVGLKLQRTGAYTTVDYTGAGEQRYPVDWLWEVKNTFKVYAYG